MKYITALLRHLRGLHRLSRFALLCGLTLMCLFYILAAACVVAAPYVQDYLYITSVYRGALEAAPASLAVGVCAGLLGDLMLRRGRQDKDTQ